ncbi:hypothetical protein [Paraglaciecola sp. L3A3]|uniref:hypothetical protein n=1 Tax=Paraglaciecola sp. L3A3 TaxID=2686358 RepID=UPI00131E6BA5|nr:hypothetical protein [Paraglaciecola sp. L3A3]
MEIVLIVLLGFFVFCIWLFPILKIAISNRTQGGEKIAWLLLTIFVFWFAWIFYLLLAPLKGSTNNQNIDN